MVQNCQDKFWNRSEKGLQIHLSGLFQKKFITLLYGVDFIRITVDEIRIYHGLKIGISGVQSVFGQIKILQELLPVLRIPGLYRFFFLSPMLLPPFLIFGDSLY